MGFYTITETFNSERGRSKSTKSQFWIAYIKRIEKIQKKSII